MVLHSRLQAVLPMLCAAGFLLLSALPLHAAEDLPEPVDKPIEFVRDIRPIFKEHCYKCHGVNKQEGGLRLDRKEAALRGGDTGKVILPGKSAQSTLIQYVAGTDPILVMPPESEGDRLSNKEVALLRAWIDQGAKWPEGADSGAEAPATSHWSFQPIERPEIPQPTRRAEWIRNPVDAFVLRKLNEAGIAPAPQADRATLIRRVYLDLLGLPPAPAEVDRFVNDERPDAYERLVDRVLASPHFGERWGRYWLDLARYADSDGYEKDRARPWAWRWRDWVIDAYNRDLPFDEFTIQQLAGDLLEDPTQKQLVATGFHRNTLTNKEGGVDQEEYRIRAVKDRAETTGTVWMGLTVACAQCHSHKYDPLTQREYYRLFAFFNSADGKDIKAPLPGEMEEYRRAKTQHDARLAELRKQVSQYEKEHLPGKLAAWEKSLDHSAIEWQTAEIGNVSAAEGIQFKKQDDGSVLVTGKNPEKATYTVTVQTPLSGITGLRLEVLPDERLPSKGPGRVKHGNFVLNDFSVTARPAEKEAGAQPVAFSRATADYYQGQDGDKSSWPVAGAIDDDPESGWAVGPQYGQEHTAVFETKNDVGFQNGTVLTVTLRQNYGKQHTIGRFRLSLTTSERPVVYTEMPDTIASILAIPREKRSDLQQQQLLQYYKMVSYSRGLDPKYVKLRQKLDEHIANAPEPPKTKARVLYRRDKPRESHVHIRGDFLRKGEEVEPGVFAVLNDLENAGEQRDRLDLARWLVDKENPLTRRVAVNRFWQHLFGKGIVKTTEDFGTRGADPTHPELLDWLATEFSRRGWSRKAMIRLIVTSATYRQSSHHRPELAGTDPQNKLLARQNRFRVSAETVRDLYLASSGLLTKKLGGPSIRPPLPESVRELGYANQVKWSESKGPEKYRRGCYIFFQRTVPYPMLKTFDAPDATVTCTRRERSNTPLQALTTLNSPVFFEAAQALGRRVVAEKPDAGAAERIEHAFRLCLGRQPDEAERKELERLYKDYLQTAQNDAEQAQKIVGSDPPQGASPAETAATVALGRVILNLDEFVTRE